MTLTTATPAAPSLQLPPATELKSEILRLKKEKDAVLLAHYYQDPDIQDLADHLGDSLELAKRARDAKDAEVILFCGVHFMAETAKIVNPKKVVVIPDLEAGCSLAEQCPADQLRAWKQRAIPTTTS
jgi:quinolinate synthase